VGAFTSNDAGRADRFVSRFCAEIRFIPEREIWLTWKNNRWQVDQDGALERLAVKLSRQLLREAAQIPGVDDQAAKKRVGASKEALALGDRRNISDFLALLRWTSISCCRFHNSTMTRGLWAQGTPLSN
jgi:D5 N terminal like